MMLSLEQLTRSSERAHRDSSAGSIIAGRRVLSASTTATNAVTLTGWQKVYTHCIITREKRRRTGGNWKLNKKTMKKDAITWKRQSRLLEITNTVAGKLCLFQPNHDRHLSDRNCRREQNEKMRATSETADSRPPCTTNNSSSNQPLVAAIVQPFH